MVTDAFYEEYQQLKRQREAHMQAEKERREAMEQERQRQERTPEKPETESRKSHQSGKLVCEEDQGVQRRHSGSGNFPEN